MTEYGRTPEDWRIVVGCTLYRDASTMGVTSLMMICCIPFLTMQLQRSESLIFWKSNPAMNKARLSQQCSHSIFTNEEFQEEDHEQVLPFGNLESHQNQACLVLSHTLYLVRNHTKKFCNKEAKKRKQTQSCQLTSPPRVLARSPGKGQAGGDTNQSFLFGKASQWEKEPSNWRRQHTTS